MIKIASLFDGIGGTPLCATLCGAEPVWASEIEEFPIKVTKYHFPNMKHHGDITKIKGDEVEPVDIIVGGSPCQDLSVAGQRKGMKHSEMGDEETTRSGLFMEQIRIVKEMRNASKLRIERRCNSEMGVGSSADHSVTERGVCSYDTNRYVQPRFMVWENVPGAFSSKGSGDSLKAGEAFRIVLEETARIADPTVRIPRPKDGWFNSGSILGDGFCISWRTVDAQYWGVPQRRRRIYLVADFGGESAPEILFEREGMPWHPQKGCNKGQGTSGEVEERSGNAIICSATQQGGAERLVNLCPTITASAGMAGNIGPWIAGEVEGGVNSAEPIVYMRGFGGRTSQDGITPTLEAVAGMGGNNQPIVCYGISSYESNSMKSDNPHSGIYEADTARTIDANGGNPGCNQGGMLVFEPRSQDGVPRISNDGLCPTINTAQGGQRQPCIVEPAMSLETYHCESHEEIDSVLKARDWKDPQCVMECGDVSGVDCRNFTETDELFGTLQAKENGGQSLNYSGALRNDSTVRRLTPLECERLQGFPDGWTDIPGASDSTRYKALGNSFAIPNAYFVIRGCIEAIERSEA